VEDLLATLQAEVTAKNLALRRAGADTVVVKVIAQLKRDEPLDLGGPNSLPYIRCAGADCGSRWEQAHYLSTLSRFSSFVVGYDFVRLPEVPIAVLGSSLAQEITRLTALYGDANITIHSGESNRSALSTNIASAIDAGSDRIGHGYNLGTLASRATRARVCQGDHPIEVSLSSNVRLGVVTSLASHPFPTYLRGTICQPARPLPVTLNTDDAGIFETDLAREFCLAASTYNLTWEEVKRVARQSLESSFASPREKSGLLAAWTQAIADFESSWSRPTVLPAACA
jgi:hypothetical protein